MLQKMGRWGALALVLALASPVSAASETSSALEGRAIARLPNGKTVATHNAPVGNRALLLRDEGEVGDFVWQQVYLRDVGHFRKLGGCQSLSNVRWRADGKEVSFTIDAATGPSTMTTSRVRYRVGENAIHRLTLREREVQSSM